MEKIKIENLTFTYPGHSKPVLNKINLSINEGEFVCICGRSGCGKTSLLRQLKPLICPVGKKEGKIFFAGTEISGLDEKTQAGEIGFVFQNPEDAIVCDKVWHELAFGLENLGIESCQIRTRVAEMASYFGIQDWYYKNVNELSGGQKQLLNLASVMVMQPSLIILDEPTSQLDPAVARTFLDTVFKINREFGTTVIISEHRLEDVFELADRVVVMDDGGIIADGDAKSVGKILKNTKNEMFCAMPTPIRVYYSLKNDGECPVTVREGRQWLSKQPVKRLEYTKTEKKINDVAVEMSDIWFRYEKNLPDILKSVSLKVKKGEIYAIVGANGAGKSTLLSVIAGTMKPYCGKVKIADGKKLALLSQNSKTIFAHKTVFEDLKEMLNDGESTERLYDVAEFCGISGFLQSHPFDLSGGEQQRAALAKVLLSKPDILLLDEVTKGLDMHFKKKFAQMLFSFKEEGTTIIMVSHDIEFCAEYADRVSMFFDGKILSEGTAREFFIRNSFYTTAANRMSRFILEGAVTDKDIICALGGKDFEIEREPLRLKKFLEKEEPKTKNPPKDKKINILWTFIFAMLFFFTQMCCDFNDYSIKSYAVQILSILFLGHSFFFILPKRDRVFEIIKPKQKISKATFVSWAIVLCLIPFTIYAGIKFFGDRRYYFISLLIIFEIMLPFIIGFEGRKTNAREIVLISVICAIGVAGRIVFALLPQFKPLIAIIIIAGICLGAESGFLVGSITAFVSNFYFTQGPWTPWQMFVFGLIGFFSGILFKYGIIRKTRLSLCVFGFLSALVLYGGIMNPASVIMWQGTISMPMIWSSIAAGLPVDLIQGMATVFFLWFGGEPMIEKLERVKEKYGINNI